MSDVFCGIGKIPTKSRRGSMKECAEKKQIRYYGIKKVDSKILEIAMGTKKNKDSRENVLKEMSKYRGRMTKYKKAVAGAKTKEDKAKFQKELDAATKQFDKYDAMFTAIERKRLADKKKVSRSKSKKSSKKGSRKMSRKGSRKGSKKGTKKSSRKMSRKGSRKGSKKGTKKSSRKMSSKGSK